MIIIFTGVHHPQRGVQLVLSAGDGEHSTVVVGQHAGAGAWAMSSASNATSDGSS
jgi:hypothetical protein